MTAVPAGGGHYGPPVAPAEARSRRVPRPSWKGVLALVMAAALAGELVWGWSALVSALERVQGAVWSWLLLAVLASLASMDAYARMQRRLLSGGGVVVPVRKATSLAYAAHSLSVTLPGGPVFSTVFNYQRLRGMGAPQGLASWTVALSGALSQGALVVIAAVAAVLAGGTTDGAGLATYLVGAVLLVLALRALGRRPALLVNAVLQALTRVNRWLRRDVRRGHDLVVGLVEQLVAVRIPRRDLWVAGGFAVANWILDAVCFYLCALATGVEDVSVVMLLLAYTAGMAAATVPILPGGLGVVDTALILGLVAGGVSGSDAIATTVLFRIITLGLIIPIGWAFWLATPGRERVTGAVAAGR